MYICVYSMYIYIYTCIFIVFTVFNIILKLLEYCAQTASSILATRMFLFSSPALVLLRRARRCH